MKMLFSQYRERSHALAGTLAAERRFPALIPRLLARLGTILELPEPVLDGSAESLFVLGQRIQDLDLCYSQNVLESMIAYAGEVLRCSVSGTWEMIWHASIGIWEPLVRTQKGKYHRIWLRIVKFLHEDGAPYVGISVEVCLRSGGLDRSELHCRSGFKIVWARGSDRMVALVPGHAERRPRSGVLQRPGVRRSRGRAHWSRRLAASQVLISSCDGFPLVWCSKWMAPTPGEAGPDVRIRSVRGSELKSVKSHVVPGMWA